MRRGDHAGRGSKSDLSGLAHLQRDLSMRSPAAYPTGLEKPFQSEQTPISRSATRSEEDLILPSLGQCVVSKSQWSRHRAGSVCAKGHLNLSFALVPARL